MPNGLWSIRVVDVTSNANTIVARTNQFNEPPEPDRQFFMVRVEMTYHGPGQESPLTVDLTAVGDSNVIYRSTNDSCGVIPDNYSQGNRLFAGGAVEGNVCWSVKTSDVPTLVMMAAPLFSLSDSGEVYFGLR